MALCHLIGLSCATSSPCQVCLLHQSKAHSAVYARFVSIGLWVGLRCRSAQRTPRPFLSAAREATAWRERRAGIVASRPRGAWSSNGKINSNKSSSKSNDRDNSNSNDERLRSRRRRAPPEMDARSAQDGQKSEAAEEPPLTPAQRLSRAEARLEEARKKVQEAAAMAEDEELKEALARADKELQSSVEVAKAWVRTAPGGQLLEFLSIGRGFVPAEERPNGVVGSDPDRPRLDTRSTRKWPPHRPQTDPRPTPHRHRTDPIHSHLSRCGGPPEV